MVALSVARPFGVGSRLRRRLVLQVVLVTGTACALMVWASLELVRDTLDDRSAAELETRARLASSALAALRQDAATTLESTATFLRRGDPEGLARLLGGGAAARNEAIRLTSRAGSHWLEIVDDEGTLISSSLWPERAGLRHRELLDLPTGAARVREAALASGNAPAFVARRELRAGSRVVHLVGGTLLDATSLSRVVGEGTWLRIQVGDREPWVVGVPPIDPHAAWQRVGGVSTGSAELATPDRGRWLLAQRPLTGGPEGSAVEAALVTAVSLSASDGQLEHVKQTLAGLAGLAVLLAGCAGLWIARRVTAPVAELVRSVDAIAAGTEDYTFTRATRDEFEELTASFSRLHRALELQHERSRAAERVAAWRDVARRVAHEVKNPLAPIRLTVENLIRARSRPGPVFDEMFDDGAATILEEVDRLKRLVGEFSEFARLPLPQTRPTDLTRLIDEVAGLYGAEPGLTIEVRHAPGLPLLPLDADQVSRALQNIVANGIEAMRTLPADHQRSLTIRTAVVDTLVCIEVCDRGAGLTTEALDKLFEPYFTTKTGGTGLGLSITYRIVTEHGGVIAAENRRSGGVRITIRFPLPGGGSVASPSVPRVQPLSGLGAHMLPDS